MTSTSLIQKMRLLTTNRSVWIRSWHKWRRTCEQTWKSNSPTAGSAWQLSPSSRRSSKTLVGFFFLDFNMNMNVFDGFAHLRWSFYIFPSIYFHFKVTLEDSLVTNTTIENPMTGGTEIVVPQMSESRWDFKHFHQGTKAFSWFLN